MRHACTWLIGISLSCLFIGCQGNTSTDQTPTGTASPATGQTTATLPADDKVTGGESKETVDTSNYVLVSLNVPNMT